MPRLSGMVSISGTAAIGETLTANTDSLGGVGTISCQWKRGTGVVGTNSNAYVVQAADLGSTITVTVTRSGYSGNKTSEPTDVVTLPLLSGTVSIVGIVEAGKPLIVNTDSLGGSGDISYQWKRGTGDDAVNIGNNSSIYVVQAADEGFAIIVTVTREGYSGSVSSEPTAAVTLPLLTGTVSIRGNAWVGQTLTAVTNSLNGSGTISYQWVRVTGGDAAIYIAINIGTNSTYVVQAADEGFAIIVIVTRAGYADSVTSEATAAVTLPPLSGTVSIRGNAWVGQTLTAVTNSLNGSGTISYQWVRGRGGDDDNIGADSTYEVQADDLGATITVTVTRAGYTDSVSSEPTAAVILPPLSGTVRISGTVSAGETLTANTSSLNGNGTISYQWKRGTGGSAALNIGTHIDNYTLQAADAGYFITVTVTRDGNSGSVSSNAVLFGQRIYGDVVKKVEFTEETTATVTFDNLSGTSVYLVKLNNSTSTANAPDTGSVRSTSPVSLMSNGGQSLPLPLNDRPRMGHPAATAFNANPPPIERATFQPLTDFISPKIGDTRTFWIEQYYNSKDWIQRSATLLAIGDYGNIWVMSNSINTAQAQELSRNFDKIYPAETNILGYEYGGGPDGDGGRDGDPKIQILVYDIVGTIGSSEVLGYFWSKDFYPNQAGSNNAEIFYIDANYTKNAPSLIYLTLAHEFQHMINFNRKYVEKGRTSATWYDETLSMMAEDVMANILGIPTTNQYHPVRDHIPNFIETYTGVGITEWPTSPYPYSKGYAFGAYLMRNYGGADLLRRILANDTANTASITAALAEIEPGMTFEKAISRFGEAMIFSGNAIPENGLTFDKTVTSTISAYNGTHTYTLNAFDIWKTKRYSSSSLGPVVYSTAQRTMRGNSVLIQQDNSWKDRTGTLSITLNKPSNANVEFYLMVR